MECARLNIVLVIIFSNKKKSILEIIILNLEGLGHILPISIV